MQEVEEHQKYIEIWSKVVDTQMHFNEMQVKSRQLGLTFVTAALGVAVVLLSNGEDFSFVVEVKNTDIYVHISVLLVLGAWIALRAVRQLDLNVYHRMLRGAVTFGMDFEENYMKKIFDLNKGMTQSISHFSRFKDATVSEGSDGKYSYEGTSKISAHDKILQFYRNTTRFLWVAAALLFAFTNASLINDLIFDVASGKPNNVTVETQ